MRAYGASLIRRSSPSHVLIIHDFQKRRLCLVGSASPSLKRDVELDRRRAAATVYILDRFCKPDYSKTFTPDFAITMLLELELAVDDFLGVRLSQDGSSSATQTRVPFSSGARPLFRRAAMVSPSTSSITR